MTPMKFAITRLLLVITLAVVALPMNSAAESQATLEWDANDVAPQGYRLYWRGENQSYNYRRYFGTGRSTAQTVFGLDENTIYYFVVRAYVGSNTSTNSNEVAFNSNGVSSTPDPNPPLQPSTVSPEGDAKSLTLQPVLQCGEFDDPDPTDQHAQTRWQIHLMDSGELALDVTSSTDLTQMTVPAGALREGTTYYWTVIHINQTGASSPPALLSYFTTAGASSTLGSSSDDGGGGGSGFGTTGCLIQTLRYR